MHDENDLVRSKREHLDNLREKGVEPYPYSYERSHTASDVRVHDEAIQPGEHTDITVSIAGRLMSTRSFGKLIFGVIHDHTGTIQICLNRAETPENIFTLFDDIDSGDILGVRGLVMKTKKGEISVLVKELTLLSKSLLPLPDKWHGLSDVEVRYRKRYLDLVANPEIKDVFLKRSRIISLMRSFLEKEGFIEVETPLLQPTYGGANARPFITSSHAWKADFYLSISPELYLKRLIVGGFDRVYTICKNFRNEDVDTTHNPEFTMMECYAAYWDYEDIMDLTERLYEHLAIEITGSTIISFKDQEIDLKAPWKRMTMYEALEAYADIVVENLSDDELRQMLFAINVELEEFKRGLAIQELFEHYCESKLIQPVFITDHPKETTPLCKLKRGDPDLIERFEPYIAGWEAGNAYSELNDPILQERFFDAQKDQGRAKGESHPADDDFIEALKLGMPPTGGLGIGVDRLVMLLTDQRSIKDVIFFPQLRPERKE